MIKLETVRQVGAELSLRIPTCAAGLLSATPAPAGETTGLELAAEALIECIGRAVPQTGGVPGGV